MTLAGAAVARKPAAFEPPRALTEEEIRLAKEQSRTQVSRFGETLEAKPKPFPWPMVTFATLSLLVAAPFAMRAFRRTANELEATQPTRARQRSGASDDDPA